MNNNNLIGFTINNPQKPGLDNIMAYNESDMFFMRFSSYLPTKADCGKNYFIDIDKNKDLDPKLETDCSNNPLLINSIRNDMGFCRTRELCKNRAYYKNYSKLRGELAGGGGEGYTGNDAKFEDHSQLYNFTILTTTNLSLGILLLGSAIFTYA